MQDSGSKFQGYDVCGIYQDTTISFNIQGKKDEDDVDEEFTSDNDN